jgi:tetraacyldisaccharide 4'-kinase
MSSTSPLRRLLLPLVPIYQLTLAAHEMRLRRMPVERLRWPVVSIGNLSTGGAGKTPLTIALARALTAQGLRVDVLSRGYGRSDPHPARVRLDGSAEEFGDEPLLIAREAGVPVYVASRRYDAGLLAEAEAAGSGFGAGRDEAPSGAEARALSEGKLRGLKPPPPSVHLLDDGFQHRRLHRDVDILIINREDWHGALLPAGNLREPRSAARRASVIAIPADDAELATLLKAWGWTGLIWRLRRTMQVPAIESPVAAFCGIARPGQFFRGLEAAGLRLASRTSFRDHHRYTAADAANLIAAARAAGAAALITTEKDLVRIGALSAAFPETLPLKTARLTIEIDNESEAIGWLASRLVPSRSHPPL